jgi:hypothetical protein
MSICIHSPVYVLVFICIYLCVYVRVYVCVRVRVCKCVDVRGAHNVLHTGRALTRSTWKLRCDK